jgi:hypothetical protein
MGPSPGGSPLAVGISEQVATKRRICFSGDDCTLPVTRKRPRCDCLRPVVIHILVDQAPHVGW